MNKSPLRARFKKEIICEFLPPVKPSSKVIILCSGMPSIPKKDELLNILSKKGYWVFLPRYRGSWESAGKFLKISPHQDVLDIVSELSSGFTDISSGRKYKIVSPEIFIIGSSFGGPAALLVSRDSRIKKVVAISPVIDWTRYSKAEPLSQLFDHVKEAYGEAYRISPKDWKKLERGIFYNPKHYADNIPGKKVIIIHAKDDDVVSYVPSLEFAEKTGSKIKILKTGGHLGLSKLMNKNIYKMVNDHFHS